MSSFSVKPNGGMSMLLGAGASISSGIMSGRQMVWDFKRKIYCIENKISEAMFPDMSKETAQREIQVYLDAKESIQVYTQHKNILIILSICLEIVGIETCIYKAK